jgi:predicted NACHT family NTPase
MSGRSLQASPEGINAARKALKARSLTQRALYERLGLSKSTVSNFFKGIGIDRNNFIDICVELELDYPDVALVVPEDQPSDDSFIDSIRQRIAPMIQQDCGTMQVLDMTQAIALSEIYTDVNLLESLTAHQRLGLGELEGLFNLASENFERLGWGKATERVQGLDAAENHPKLMIWGKPGAGKTTFLKYVAIESIEGRFQAQQVPLFIGMKEFAEKEHNPDILTYIHQKVATSRIKAEEIDQLLQQGRAILLLDGLDEVLQEDSHRVIQQIQSLADHPQYRQNRFLITCRIAAKEYLFRGFKEVEVADFNADQIAGFVNNWFRAKDPVKAETFILKLNNNEPIQELASSPLLLTLLCLVFGEINDFPHNRAELYEEGIDILLKKWDAKRNIPRDVVYKQLSNKRKEDLLSYIAYTAFLDGKYFFKQQQAENLIEEFIKNLPDAQTDPEALRLDSEAVLRSIGAQHGLLVERAKNIYSFSHLTFQEYFTARKLTLRPNRETFELLVSYIHEKSWQEVFFLTFEKLDDATELAQMMKNAIDNLVAEDEKIQRFLLWLVSKVSSVEYTKEEIIKIDQKFDNLVIVNSADTKLRFFYIELELFLNLDLELDMDLDHDLELDLNLDRCLLLSFDPYLDRYLYQQLDGLLNKLSPLVLMKAELQSLRNQLPDRNNRDQVQQWWQAKGKSWTEKLRAIMIKHRNIGHDWQFSGKQKALLKKYREANILLIQCLGRDCVIDRSVREEIERTLFLPSRQSAVD